MSSPNKPSFEILLASIKPFALLLQDRAAASEAITQGLVREVYLHAIEYTTMPKSTKGMMFLFYGLGMTLMGGIGCWFTGLILYESFSGKSGGEWLVYIFILPLFLLSLACAVLAPVFMGMAEFFKPLDLPIIFDRQRRKVYRMLEDRDAKQRGQIKVLEHDWDDIVAIHSVTISTPGNGIGAQRSHTLWLLVRDKDSGGFNGKITPENQPPYLHAFALAGFLALNAFNTPRIWEHLRRYMNENGPALPEGEALADTTVPLTWWQSLGAVSVFGPGYAKRWREGWGWMALTHLFSPLMLPLDVLMATTNWLSYKTAYPVQWPQDVLDKVGPPVRRAS
jgi:hypothetical protein